MLRPVSSAAKATCASTESETATIIAVVGAYADDLLAAKTNTAAVDQLKNILASLSIEDLVRVSKFLGIRATLHDDGGYTLDQEKSIGDLLRTNGLADAHSTRAPIDDDCYGVTFDDANLLGPWNKRAGPTIREFRSLVGSFLWVARCTRPDIAFAVHKATRQMQSSRLHD